MTIAAEALAKRIRKLLAHRQGIVEKRIIGGTGFMLLGNLAVGVTARGDLLVRLEPDRTAAALRRPGAYQMKMGERDMPGYIGVAASEIADSDELRGWVTIALDYARMLPPKESVRART